MIEPYLDANGHLISEESWRSFVDDAAHAPFTTLPHDAVMRALATKVAAAIAARIPLRDPGRIGVLFSGGVDSTLIAFLLKQAGLDPLCVTVGFQDGNAKEPEDVVESRKIANELGLQHVVVMLDLEQAHEIVTKTVKMLGPQLTNVVNVGVGSVEVAGFEEGIAHGCMCFFGGLGSEELFAGYDRHEKALASGGYAALHAECIAGLRGMYQRDLKRDIAIANACDVTAATPFLDEDLLKFSLTIPAEMKISAERTFMGKGRGDVPDERTVKKLILREAAVAVGLPEAFAFRPKRAAQYGSRMNNALTMLAEKRGFERKDAYLKSLF